MNVLLLAIDTLRADHLGCYGYHRRTSPVIDSLASRGTLFEQCHSQAPWTIPSFTTIMTGMYPESHKIAASPWNVPNANGIALDDRVPVLAERLLASGYVTMALDNLQQMASHPRWFVRGYNYYINLTRKPGLWHHHVRADEIHSELIGWLQRHRDDQFFAFVHYWEPHLPYNQPAEYHGLFPAGIDQPVITRNGREYVPRWGFRDELTPRMLESVDAYDEEIRFVDDYIGRVVEELDRLHLLDNTMIAVVGDHGECMVEHGVLFNHMELYEPTVHVPLVIVAPGGQVAGRRVDALVEHVDIVPTILELAGVPVTADLDGRSLVPWLQGGTPDWRTTSHAVQDGAHPCRMILDRDWKLLVRLPSGGAPGRLELYSRRDDPYELANVAGVEPDIAANLQRAAAAFVESQLTRHGGTDPLIDPAWSIDFNQFPGDPVLGEFYRWLKDGPLASSGGVIAPGRLAQIGPYSEQRFYQLRRGD